MGSHWTKDSGSSSTQFFSFGDINALRKHDPMGWIKKKASLIRETFIKKMRLAEMETPPTSEEDVVIGGVKRKAGRDRKEPQEKKRRRLDLLTFDNESLSTSSDTENSNTSVENVSRRGGKRKADDEDGPDGKKRRVDLKETKKKTKKEKQALLALEAKAKFEAKYKQEEKLGEGGFGFVFGGYRKEDNLPVAIKHIPKDDIAPKHKDNNGKQIPMEVAIMLKLAAESEGPSAPVALLDWYDLDQELILVMERPMPATDLLEYINCNGGSLDEAEAKVILRQLVDAAIDLEKKHIFHRDIKVENILIETSSDVPRVRLIDFGLSCFVKKRSSYRLFCGTHIPPEWYDCGVYRAGPTTAFEMGVVLFETLSNGLPFHTKRFYREEQRIDQKLSNKCKQFLSACLNGDPDQRLTLEQLRDHPWLR